MATQNSITKSVLDIVTASMKKLGILSAQENPPAADGDWILEELQRIIDDYNSQVKMVYNVNFTLFTLNPPADPLIPVSIGPGADFDCNQRPVSIPSIGLVLEGTPGVELPLNRRDDDWWANNRIKALTSTLPTDYYYSPSWTVDDDGHQLGGIFFWPVPTASHQVNLRSRQVLGEFLSVTDSFTMPPGYWRLIVCELAITIGPSFGKEASPTIVAEWKRSLKSVQANNISSPRLASDAPSQVSGQGRPDFNFLDGLSR